MIPTLFSDLDTGVACDGGLVTAAIDVAVQRIGIDLDKSINALISKGPFCCLLGNDSSVYDDLCVATDLAHIAATVDIAEYL